MGHPGSWPFDQPEDEAAISETSVVEGGAPILLAIHYSEDRSWAFLSGEAFDPAKGLVIGMGEAVALDDTIRSIADLPPGWTATRARVGAEWVRQADPDI
jgi:hypothetical protein